MQIAVIVGSVRPGRVGPKIAEWFLSQASAGGGADFDLVDLGDHALPRDDGDANGGANALPAPDALAARLARADGFVVVTPEYNHSYPAALKETIDRYTAEWRAKPVAFVSYGGVSGGLRSVEHLRNVFAELHAVTVRTSVTVPEVWRYAGGSGAFAAPPPTSSIPKMLAELHWWAKSLRAARAKTPYPA